MAELLLLLVVVALAALVCARVRQLDGAWPARGRLSHVFARRRRSTREPGESLALADLTHALYESLTDPKLRLASDRTIVWTTSAFDVHAVAADAAAVTAQLDELVDDLNALILRRRSRDRLRIATPVHVVDVIAVERDGEPRLAPHRARELKDLSPSSRSSPPAATEW